MWPGSWLCEFLLQSFGIMSRGGVSEKSWTTKRVMLGGGAADEGQRNAECKVRKRLNGEDKAHGKIRQVDASRLPKAFHGFV